MDWYAQTANFFIDFCPCLCMRTFVRHFFFFLRSSMAFVSYNAKYMDLMLLLLLNHVRLATNSTTQFFFSISIQLNLVFHSTCTIFLFQCVCVILFFSFIHQLAEIPMYSYCIGSLRFCNNLMSTQNGQKYSENKKKNKRWCKYEKKTERIAFSLFLWTIFILHFCC